MKIIHVLGHNSNWSIESHNQQNIGEYFLITAFTHGADFDKKKSLKPILSKSMIDLQFYGKKSSGDITGGKLAEFSFHPANYKGTDETNVYFETCLKEAIKFQIDKGFTKIIIPHFYENEEVNQIINTIKTINKYLSKNKVDEVKYYMTIAFANHIIIDKDKVEEILFACTDKDIVFDGFFIACENKPESRQKISKDFKVIKNLSKVFITLKNQGFETIYAYANWDAILFLAQTNIDYITIGTYENLRKFDIKRFTEDQLGGGSKGYYFSEKLLNMIRADDLKILKETGDLNFISNEKNIFSDIILQEGYQWNIHKPDVNKNYLLSINRLLKMIASFEEIHERKKFVLNLIDRAISLYDKLEEDNAYLYFESGNYFLNEWKTYLSKS